jgi:predicted amidohydrolase
MTTPAPVTPQALRVACVQIDGRDGDRTQRTADALDGVHAAAAQGARLIVLPELWPVGFFHFDDYDRVAEPLTGPTVAALADAARATGAWVYTGSFIERSQRGIHNAGVLLDPDGRARLVYRKVHLFGYQSDEARLLTPGDDVATAATPFGTVGATTCFDLRFPELYRDLVDRGAQLVVVASAWPTARLEHWRLLLRARAVENQLFVIACNAAGSDAGVALAGHSAIVDPWGEVLAEADDRPQTLIADLDPSRVDAIRGRYPFLAERRYRAEPLPAYDPNP